ncbi:hypothetical protein NECAME_01658 [Necator americanus]|uniref:Uncharacterized protein n=1 Tax=Necator americanus TaxID=51031 RepID=W2TTK3_NECAM|nr:hypothetical protein NECAME_01658 [Necator americanus]ETN84431.1 hypothetical protein NECAME_01658 [Necator americanus]
MTIVELAAFRVEQKQFRALSYNTDWKSMELEYIAAITDFAFNGIAFPNRKDFDPAIVMVH